MQDSHRRRGDAIPPDAGPPWQAAPDRLVLTDDEAHVWRVGLDTLTCDAPDLYHSLHTDERARADRFVFDQDRHRFVAGPREIARSRLRSIRETGRYVVGRTRRGGNSLELTRVELERRGGRLTCLDHFRAAIGLIPLTDRHRIEVHPSGLGRGESEDCLRLRGIVSTVGDLEKKLKNWTISRRRSERDSHVLEISRELQAGGDHRCHHRMLPFV